MIDRENDLLRLKSEAIGYFFDFVDRGSLARVNLALLDQLLVADLDPKASKHGLESGRSAVQRGMLPNSGASIARSGSPTPAAAVCDKKPATVTTGPAQKAATIASARFMAECSN
jgi:hypothetical protein